MKNILNKVCSKIFHHTLSGLEKVMETLVASCWIWSGELVWHAVKYGPVLHNWPALFT